MQLWSRNLIRQISYFAVSTTLTLFSNFALAASYGRLIAFGDSLSDGGTYAAVSADHGGGKFTTNPGKLWVEVIADHIGARLTPNRTEGYGAPVEILGGLNYAQGGAQVAIPAPPLGRPSASRRPLTTQLKNFLFEHKAFASDDLVTIQGGANDVMGMAIAVQKGLLSESRALGLNQIAAKGLADLAKTIVKAGNPKVLVLNLPAIEQTPFAMNQTAATRRLITTMTGEFNARLQSDLAGTSGVTLIDIYTFDSNFNHDFTSRGFTNVTKPACDFQAMGTSSSLYCSGKTLVAPNADLKYKFADNLHPSTGYSKVIGDFVFAEFSRLNP